MHWKAGQAPQRYSLRSLAIRTAAATVFAGLLTALLVGLIRSDGIHQEGLAIEHTLRRASLDVRVLPISDVWTPSDGSNLGKRVQAPPTVLLPKSSSLYDTEQFKQQLQAQAEERIGQVSRLQSSLEQPLGPSAGTNPLCIALKDRMGTVAVIGNGPLSVEDRDAIELHETVVRFNLMNNWRRFRERVDIWTMRYSKEASAGYWGINNINSAEAHRILASLRGVWLVGGNQTHADTLLRRHPIMEAHNPVLMPEAPMNKAFAERILMSPGSYPSTGFVGIQAILHCAPASSIMHLYGFNWSNKTWSGHNVSAEQEFIRGLEAQGRAVVHETACAGMRECGEGDVDASCHWSTDGKYLCLRGKPKKWVDTTSMVDAKRQEELDFASHPF